MPVDDAHDEGLSGWARLLLALPVAIVVTALGAVSMVAGAVGRLVWSAPEPPPPPPRHHAKRVREQAAAAMRAARDSGLLSKPRR